MLSAGTSWAQPPKAQWQVLQGAGKTKPGTHAAVPSRYTVLFGSGGCGKESEEGRRPQVPRVEALRCVPRWLTRDFGAERFPGPRALGSVVAWPLGQAIAHVLGQDRRIDGGCSLPRREWASPCLGLLALTGLFLRVAGIRSLSSPPS